MTTQEIEELQNEINRLNEELEEKENKIDDLEDKILSERKEFKTKISNLEYDNKQLNDDIKELEQEINNKNKEISFKNRWLSELKETTSQYEETILQYKNNDKIKELEKQLIEKDNVITQLNNELNTLRCSGVKQTQNNKINISNIEEKTTTKEQNKTIKQLQDIIILKDEYIKKIKKPIDRSVTVGKDKKYNHIEEIPRYESDYKYYSNFIASPYRKNYRLNITNYKKCTDYKYQPDKSMKFLEDLNIKRNEKTQKYDLTPIQLDALVKKVILYIHNEGIYILH